MRNNYGKRLLSTGGFFELSGAYVLSKKLENALIAWLRHRDIARATHLAGGVFSTFHPKPG